MLILNLSKPLSPKQITQLRGKMIKQVIEVSVCFYIETPYAKHIVALVNNIGFTLQQCQTQPNLTNLQSFNFITLALLELHGCMGYFPPCLRLRLVKDSLPQEFEVAEILNPQNISDFACAKRCQEK